MATTTTFSSPGQHQYTTPSGVDVIQIELVAPGGGGGGSDGQTGADGGDGGRLVITVAVSDGEVIDVWVGEGGTGGDLDTAGVAGTLGYNTGGDGGDATNGGGGGGGGASTAAERNADGHRYGRASAGGGGGGTGPGDSGGGGGGADGGLGGEGTTDTEDGSDAAGTGNGGDGGDAGVVGADGGTSDDGSVTVETATVGGGASGGAGGSNAGADGTDGQVVITEAPVAPPNFSVDAHTNTTVDLSWDDVAEEDSYTAEYRLTGAASWTTFSTLAAGTTTETVTGLSEGRDYEFRVGATNTVGTSYTAALTQQTDLPAPSNIDVTNADADNNVPGTSADIAWTDNAADEDGYRVYLSTDRFATKTNVSGDLAADTTTYTASGLLDGERYQVGVAVFTADVEVLVTENV